MLPFTRKRLVIALVVFSCAVLAMAKFGPASNAEIGQIADSTTAAAGATPTATAAGTPPICPSDVFFNTAAITINDNGPASPYPSNITVSNVSGTVTNVSVTLIGLNHTFPDDIDIMLVGPGGQNTLLMSDAGGSAGIAGATLDFDDAAADALPDSTQISSGTYKPTNFDTDTDAFPPPGPIPAATASLSVFNGINPNGTWSLYVRDDLGNNVGSIVSGWILHFRTVCITPSPTPTASPNLPISVSLPHMIRTPGLITVPITVGDMTGHGIISYDLQITANPSVVVPASPPFDQTGTLSSLMSVTSNTANPGHFIISAFQATELSSSGTLLNLKFNVIGFPGQAAGLNFSNYTDPGGGFHPAFQFNEGDPPATTTNGLIEIPGDSTPTFTPTWTATSTPTFTPTATPSNATVQFSSATYITNEGQLAAITITRTGDLSGTNTVFFSTTGGTATGGAFCNFFTDYVTVSQQPVGFGPGDAMATVNVEICADTATKGNETVDLGLSAFNTTLGTPSVAVLSINGTTPTPTATFTPTRTPTVIPSPFPEYDLTISQADSPDPVFFNQPLTYTLTVTNSPAALGGGACPNVRFGWPILTPFAFSSASGTNGYVGTVDANGVTFTGGCVSSQGGVVGTATLSVVIIPATTFASGFTSFGNNVIVDPENNWAENDETNNTATTIFTAVNPGSTPLDTRTPTFTSTPTPTNTVTATVTSTPTAVPTCTPLAFTNPTVLPINDGGMSSSGIPVSNFLGTVTKVTVDLNGVSHSYPDDIDIMLVGPGGQNTLLMSDAGGDSDTNGSSFTFDDAVPLALPDETQLSSGTFGPTNYDTTTDVFPAPAPAPAPGGPVAMGVFIGTNPNGVWTLYVRDDTNLDTGIISGGWTLHITTTGGSICATATATATATSFQPTPSLSFSSATYNEDESQVAAITIRKVIGVEPAYVSFSTMNGTATGGEACTSGVDYINVSQQVFLPRYELEKTVYVTTCGDSLRESAETINIRLSNPILGTLGLSSAVLTINDTASTLRNPENISITGGGSAMPYPSTIIVTGGPTTIGSMRVTLYDLSSRFTDTADFLLVGPTGTKYILLAGAGGLTQSAPATLNLTDTAGQVVPDNGPLFGGDFEPTSWVSVGDLPPPAPPGPYNLPGSTVGGTGTQTLAGNFSGTDANGVWRLYVQDRSLATDRVGNLGGGWGLEFLGPTAANASISGRVMTADGRGIRNARVVVTGNSLPPPVVATTGSFGYFTFDGLATGETYVVSVNSRRYTFSTPSRVISLVDNVIDADFIADPQE